MSILAGSGFVSYMADSPISLLESSRARGGTFTSPADFCVNALLGALQVVLPDETPRDDLEIMKLAFIAALVERYQWRMLLLSKPTRGRANPDGIDEGQGDWVSILGMKWQFSALAPFISTTLESGLASTRAVQGEENILLPPLTHGCALDSLSQVDALIAGPDRSLHNPYKIFLFETSRPETEGWKTCRFYKSVRCPHFGKPRDKQSLCVVTMVPFERASHEFGTDCIALLPLERIYRYEHSPLVHPLRCVILCDIKKGHSQGSVAACGVFAGIGDFTFENDNTSGEAVKDILGSPQWRIYIY